MPGAEELKEVVMEVSSSAGFSGEGGGTRRRRRGGRRTRRETGMGSQEGGDVDAGATVEKMDSAPTPAPTPAIKTTPPPKSLPPLTGGGVKKAPIIVLAPAKKKPAKVMLVSKPKDATSPSTPTVSKQHLARKTFKAKRIRLTIDNSAKTQRRRRQVLQSVDDMNEERLRDLAVGARLSRRESVAKVPVALLRQMIKDYQTVKGGLV
jgi:hypothetical protein